MTITESLLSLRSYLLVSAALLVSSAAMATAGDKHRPHPKPLVIAEQGSFAVGGTVLKVPGTFDPTVFFPPQDGQTFHGDHAYVQYQKPVKPRKYPLVMWHGGGQFSKTWETTPDGREGFQNIFLRRDFSVYIIDQPRRGRAGNSTVGTTLTPNAQDQFLFNIFRLGEWPNFFPNVSFPRDPESLNQYYRQTTPDTGPNEIEIGAKATSVLFDEIGEAVLLTHSDSGSRGWVTAIKNSKVKAIVSYEPVQFTFPEGQLPPPRGVLPQLSVSLAEFKKLTKIPIQLIYGDNIPSQPTTNAGLQLWVDTLANAKDFVKKVNEYGGQAQLVILPQIGVRGNTHFPFSDLNNVKIADLLSKYLERKGLDRYPRGYDHYAAN